MTDTPPVAGRTSGRILFLTKGEHSPSFRYRAMAFFPWMRRAGWNPAHGHWLGTGRGLLQLLRQARQADIVVVQRLLPIRPVQALIRRYSRRLVFDFDDAVFLRSTGQPWRLRRRRFESWVGRCNEIWAGNTHLAGEAMRFNSRVRVLPTTIDPGEYRIDETRFACGFQPVWIGSASTGRYLRWIQPGLERASQAIPGFRLKVVADFRLSAVGMAISNRSWTRQTECRELLECHAGLAPLPDDGWTRGKCGLKILQYMAAGLPVVASPVGVQREMIAHEQTGLLADTEPEWVEGLLRLAADRAWQRKMGQAGRQRVEDSYSHEVAWPILQDALSGLRP